MPVLGATSDPFSPFRGAYVPKGSLDVWRSVRSLSASQLIEIVVFGDSTSSGSTTDPVKAEYSWTQKLRALFAAAGYTDGGRGLVYADSNDTTPLNGDPLTTIVSQTGFNAGAVAFSIRPGSITSTTAADAITLQGVCTAIRIQYSRIAGTTGSFSYAVDGGSPVTVTTGGIASEVGGNVVQVSGLTLGTHTVTIVNLGGGISFPPPAGTTTLTTGTLAAGTYDYKVTRVPTGGTGETLGTATTPITLGGAAGVTITSAHNGSGTFKYYRRTNSTGSYLLVGTLVNTAGAGGFDNFTDDGSATPGAAAPSTDTSNDPATKTVSFNVDFVKSVGIVVHKDATSGASTSTYFQLPNPSLGSFGAELSLGLVLGTNGEATAWQGTSRATSPPARNVKLAVCALGVNDLQGISLASSGGPTNTEQANADRAAALMVNNVTNFVRLCRAGSIDPLIVVPHFDLAQNGYTWGGQFAAALHGVARGLNCAVVDFNEAIRPISTMVARGLGAPAVHSTAATYDAEAQLVFDLLTAAA